MHKDTYAAEYVTTECDGVSSPWEHGTVELTRRRIAHSVSSRKRVDIIARAKQLGVKVTNAKAKVTTEI